MFSLKGTQLNESIHTECTSPSSCKAFYACKSGYYFLNRNNTRVCENGVWSPKPTCISEY